MLTGTAMGTTATVTERSLGASTPISLSPGRRRILGCGAFLHVAVLTRQPGHHILTAADVDISTVEGHDGGVAVARDDGTGGEGAPMGASDGMVDVASLARSTASECARSRPGLRVAVTVPGEIWVPADVDLIRSSWQGYCLVMADRLSLAGTLWVTAEFDREGARVHLVAEDDGPPIPSAEWSEVWLPGLRDGASSGSPVARLLAIDQIREMGGDISVGTGASSTSVMMSLPTLVSPTRDSGGAH